MRVRLQTHEPLPAIRCWFEVRPEDPEHATVAALSLHIAEQLGLDGSLDMELDGFALLPACRTGGLVRENDLLQIKPSAQARPLTGKRKRYETSSDEASSDEASDDAESDDDDESDSQSEARTRQAALRRSMRRLLENAQRGRRRSALQASRRSGAAHGDTILTLDCDSDYMDEEEEDDEDEDEELQRHVVTDTDEGSSHTAIASDAESDSTSEDSSEDSSSSESESLSSEEVQDSTSEEEESSESSSSDSEAEPPVQPSKIELPVKPVSQKSTPKATPQSTPKPTPRASPKRAAASAGNDSQQDMDDDEAGGSGSAAFANPVRVPAGLGKSKRKAVQSMLHIERSHVRFDGLDGAEGPESARDRQSSELPLIKETPSVAKESVADHGDSSSNSTKAGEEVEQQEEPRVVYTEVDLYDGPKPPAKSRSQSRRERKKKRGAQLSQAAGTSPAATPNGDSKQQKQTGPSLTKQADDSSQHAKKRVRLAEPEENSDEDNEDSGTVEIHGDNQTAKQSEARQVAPARMDYDSLPFVTGLPRVGMTIAFKTIELSAEYTPEISAYKEAVVTALDLQGSVVSMQLAPHSRGPPAKPKAESSWGQTRRFDRLGAEGEEDDEENEGEADESGQASETDGMVDIALQDMIEVRLVSA
ncbi:hypothetical protein BC831DRAFT_513383 [Entophlyctis helioformis]|nr:hypothetical protein BC831DRAFT_513383 [Entophlyctis helioformis]